MSLSFFFRKKERDQEEEKIEEKEESAWGKEAEDFERQIKEEHEKEYREEYEEIKKYIRKNIDSCKIIVYSLLQTHCKIKRLSIYIHSTPLTFLGKQQITCIFKDKLVYLGETDYKKSLVDEIRNYKNKEEK